MSSARLSEYEKFVLIIEAAKKSATAGLEEAVGKRPKRNCSATCTQKNNVKPWKKRDTSITTADAPLKDRISPLLQQQEQPQKLQQQQQQEQQQSQPHQPQQLEDNGKVKGPVDLACFTSGDFQTPACDALSTHKPVVYKYVVEKNKLSDGYCVEMVGISDHFTPSFTLSTPVAETTPAQQVLPVSSLLCDDGKHAEQPREDDKKPGPIKCEDADRFIKSPETVNTPAQQQPCKTVNDLSVEEVRNLPRYPRIDDKRDKLDQCSRSRKSRGENDESPLDAIPLHLTQSVKKVDACKTSLDHGTTKEHEINNCCHTKSTAH